MINIKSFYFNPFEECSTLAWDQGGEAVIVDPGCLAREETDALTRFIAGNGLRPVYILLTHAHFDHIFGVNTLAKLYDIPVLMSATDKVIIENNKYFCMNFGLPLPDNGFAEGIWVEYGGGDTCPAGAGQHPSDTTVKAGGPNPAEVRKYPSVLTVKDGDIVTWGEGNRWEVLDTPGHTPGGVCYLDRGARLLLSGDTLFAGSIGRTDNRWGDYDALIRSIFEKLMTLDGDIDVIPGHGPQTTIADERTKNPFLMPFNEELPPEE